MASYETALRSATAVLSARALASVTAPGWPDALDDAGTSPRQPGRELPEPRSRAVLALLRLVAA